MFDINVRMQYAFQYECRAEISERIKKQTYFQQAELQNRFFLLRCFYFGIMRCLYAYDKILC